MPYRRHGCLGTRHFFLRRGGDEMRCAEKGANEKTSLEIHGWSYLDVAVDAIGG